MIDIEKVKKDIVAALLPINPEQIILFGSYAYGTPGEGSDLDICVIKKNYDNKFKEVSKIRKALSGIRIGKDILNPRLDEFNFYKNECGSVYKEIADKGIVLWNS